MLVILVVVVVVVILVVVVVVILVVMLVVVVILVVVVVVVVVVEVVVMVIVVVVVVVVEVLEVEAAVVFLNLAVQGKTTIPNTSVAQKNKKITEGGIFTPILTQSTMAYGAVRSETSHLIKVLFHSLRYVFS